MRSLSARHGRYCHSSRIAGPRQSPELVSTIAAGKRRFKKGRLPAANCANQCTCPGNATVEEVIIGVLGYPIASQPDGYNSAMAAEFPSQEEEPREYSV